MVSKAFFQSGARSKALLSSQQYCMLHFSSYSGCPRDDFGFKYFICRSFSYRMFHNKQRKKNDEFLSPRKKLKRHVESLFLENKLSGQETDDLATNIGQCVTDFQPKGSTAKNAARDWMRKCLKKNGWPPVYVAEIATWDPKMQTQRLSPLAFILPHEIVFQLLKRNTVETLCQTEGGTQSLKDHVAKAKECLKGSVIPLGLPMNWDRSESLELILVNLPGLPKDSGSTSWRFPCAAISHKNVAKGLTFNQIFEVLSWSFQQLFVGKMPCSRHDGKPFTATQCSVFSEFCSCFGQLVCFQMLTWGRVCFGIKTG